MRLLAGGRGETRDVRATFYPCGSLLLPDHMLLHSREALDRQLGCSISQTV